MLLRSLIVTGRRILEVCWVCVHLSHADGCEKATLLRLSSIERIVMVFRKEPILHIRSINNKRVHMEWVS